MDWPMAEGAIGPDTVVLPPPLIDHALRFSQRVEDLSAKELVPRHA
jgi:hypothetical protein